MQDNTNYPPAGRRAFSCPNQDKSLCLLASPSGKGSTHTNLLVGVTPVGKTPTVGAQGRGPTCFSPISHSFLDGRSHFADSVLHGDLVWESEFMSTGSGYDMILLSIKGPGGARVVPARLGAPRRPRHHASPPKKRRGQHHHRSSASSRPTVRARQEVTQESTAPCAGAVSVTAQRHEDRTMTGGDAPRALSPTARLLPHGLFAPRRALLFGLDNATASLTRAICPNAQTYVERPMVLPHDLEAQQPKSELLDFSQS